MLKDLFAYSIGNLRKRRLRSWLTMIGIFIGIAAVISLIGLGEGLRNAIQQQFGFLGPDVLSVQASGISFAGPPGQGVVEPLKEELVDKVKNIKGVDAAFQRKIESATMEFNDKQNVVFTASVPGGDDRKIFERIVNLRSSKGRLLKEGDTKKALLGNEFTKDDIFGKGIKIGNSILINGEKFEVAGIIEKKGSFIFDNGVYLNEESMDELFGDDNTADVIAVRVKNPENIGAVQESIEKLLRKERDVKEGDENFQVVAPQSTLESLNSTIFAVQLFVYIIALISLIVGGIGIMNTMYTAVLERTKEIGIMKAIGAKNSAIFYIFFIESGILGSVGGLIGVILGMGLAYGMAFAGKLALGSELIQASVSPFLIIGALLFSFLLGSIFGVLPALQASKLQPVEALRSK